MPLPQKHLLIKRSKIYEAGKGLFTKILIAKGTYIAEYKGKITTWKEVQKSEVFNGYVYYVNRNYVIDAMPYIKTFARYANDANGLVKIKGLNNNCEYVKENGKVFIKAIKNIKAGEEILIPYGKDYWDVIRYNNKLAKKEKNKNLKK